jgi:hypothetical protein
LTPFGRQPSQPTRVTLTTTICRGGRCACIGALLFRATQWALPNDAHCFRQTCSDCRPHERKRIFGLSPLGARRALNRVAAQTKRLLKQFLFCRRYRLDEADSRDASASDALNVEAHGPPRSTSGGSKPHFRASEKSRNNEPHQERTLVNAVVNESCSESLAPKVYHVFDRIRAKCRFCSRFALTWG